MFRSVQAILFVPAAQVVFGQTALFFLQNAFL